MALNVEVWRLIRYLFWMVFYEVSLHFIYYSAVIFDVQLVSRLSYWELCGLGYWLGQAFMVKYVVLYGLPGVLARLDGVDAPLVPHCLSYLTLYSQVWKWFDKGLYNFLKR